MQKILIVITDGALDKIDSEIFGSVGLLKYKYEKNSTNQVTIRSLQRLSSLNDKFNKIILTGHASDNGFSGIKPYNKVPGKKIINDILKLLNPEKAELILLGCETGRKWSELKPIDRNFKKESSENTVKAFGFSYHKSKDNLTKNLILKAPIGLEYSTSEGNSFIVKEGESNPFATAFQSIAWTEIDLVKLISESTNKDITIIKSIVEKLLLSFLYAKKDIDFQLIKQSISYPFYKGLENELINLAEKIYSWAEQEFPFDAKISSWDIDVLTVLIKEYIKLCEKDDELLLLSPILSAYKDAYIASIPGEGGLPVSNIEDELKVTKTTDRWVYEELNK